MTGVALVTPSVAYEHKVRRACEDWPEATVTRWHAEVTDVDPLVAVKTLAAGGPSVVTVGPNLPLDTALELARAVEDEHPEIALVLVAEPSPELWERALRAGVRDVVAPDADDEETRRVFHRVLAAATRQRHNLVAETGLRTSQARVITLVAPKGGVGKTFLATNLAVGLAGGGAGRVALVDLDLQFGDVADALALRPEHSIGDLESSTGGVNATTLKVFLTPRGDHLYVLAAPDSPAEGETVGLATVERALRHLAEDFDHVVVDTSAGLSETTLAAIEASTDLVFMCDKSVSALRSLRKVVDAVDQLGLGGSTRHFVLNRADVETGIEPAEAESLVGIPVTTQIPTGKGVTAAMNRGIPVVEADPRSAVARSLATATAVFHHPPAERGGIFRRRR